MSEGGQDSGEKTFDPTPQKLQKARDKGEIARSTDLAVAAAYGGLVLTVVAAGASSVQSLGSVLIMFLDQPGALADFDLSGDSQALLAPAFYQTAVAVFPWFVVPALAVILITLAQRAFVVTPSKLQPKLSRISLISNAKNKFGRSGFFEFAKSFAKLLLYSLCLAVFLRAKLPDMISAARTDPTGAVVLMASMCMQFLLVVLLISVALGLLDVVWQHQEHLRKNRMSRKDMMDESKDAEGDPHMKQSRQQKGRQIAMSQMISDVAKADVVVVNPTHYAIALQWDRTPGSAPVCVAKGVDEVAATIRRAASEAGVPIHSDPPTARALYGTVDVGQEIPESHYREVAAAIRFAQDMRVRARGRGA